MKYCVFNMVEDGYLHSRYGKDIIGIEFYFQNGLDNDYFPDNLVTLIMGSLYGHTLMHIKHGLEVRFIDITLFNFCLPYKGQLLMVPIDYCKIKTLMEFNFVEAIKI